MEKYSLQVRCPHCAHQFTDPEKLIDGKPSIKVKVSFNENEGNINLSSVYGSYKHESTLEIPYHRIAKFSCPHCNESLTTIDQCDHCRALMVAFSLEKGGKVYICSRKGCENHLLAFKDINDAMLRFQQNYGG